MSKLLGGLFSRPSGKTSGIVFGAGRTTRGKQVTSREYVIPADPRTQAQVLQRSKMPYSTEIIQKLGRQVYQLAWNRARKNLPGFQSLSSFLMEGMTSAGVFEGTPARTSLGVLHAPQTVTAAIIDDTVTVEWSDELGDIGSPDDEVKIFAFDASPGSEPGTRPVASDVDTGATRADGDVDITLPENPSGDTIVVIWFESDAIGVPSSHKRSAAVWVRIDD